MADALAELFVTLGLKDEMSGKLSASLTAASALSVGLNTLANAAKGPIESFNKMEAASTKLSLQTGLSREATDKMILSMKNGGNTISGVTDLLSRLAKEGVTTEEGLQKAGKAFSTLGKAVGEPSAAIADKLIPAFNAFNIPLEDAGKYIDGLTITFNETGVSADEFATMMTRMGPKLSDVGIGFEDIQTAMGALADEGYKGRSMMQKLNEIFKEDAEAAKAVEEAQKGVEEAQKAVEDATNRLADAQDKLADTQERLRDANDDYADSTDNVKDAQDRVAKASEDLAEAQAKLAEVQGDSESSASDLLSAQNDVADAERGLEAAHRDVAKAQRDLADSGRGVEEAQKGVSDATKGVQDAQAELTDAEKAVIEAQNKLTEAQKKGLDSNHDGVVSTQELAKALGVSEETLESARQKMENSAGAAKKYADAARLATPLNAAFNDTMEKISLSIGGALQPFEGLVGGIGAVSGAMSAIAMPILLFQSLGPALQAVTGGQLLTGLGTLATSITGVGASMTAALVPALIAAAPIIAGIGIALLAIYALNELGVFKWIMEQGAAFAEWIKTFDLAKAFQGVIDFFTNLPNTIITALTGGGGGSGLGIVETIMKIIFPPLIILDLLNQAFPQIGEWFGSIGQKVLDILGSIDPIGIVAKIIDTIFPGAIILDDLDDPFAPIRDWFLSIPTKIISVLTSIDPNTVVSVILGIIFPPTLILSALGVNWIEIGTWFASLPGKVLETLSAVAQDVSTLINTIFPVDAIVSGLTSGFGKIIAMVVAFGSNFIAGIRDSVTGAGKVFTDFYTNLTSALATFISAFIQSWVTGFTTILTTVTSFFTDAITAAATFFTDVIAKATEFFTGIITSVTTFVTDATAKIVGFFTDIIAQLVAWILVFTNDMVVFFADIILKLTGWITDFTTSVVNFFADIIAKLVQWIVDFTTPVVNFFADILAKLSTWITGFTTAVVNFFADILVKLAEWAKNTIDGFVKCFTDVAAAIVAPLKSIYDTIYKSLTDIWNFVKGVWDNIIKAFNDIISKIPIIGGSQSSSVPSYAVGTDYVPETGIALIHRGERIIPAREVQNQQPAMSSGGGGMTINGNVSLSADYPWQRYKRDVERQQRIDRARRGTIS